jgi:YggT family protein
MSFGGGSPLAEALDLLFLALETALILRILVSWISPSPYPDSPVKRVLWAVTEPILAPLRRVLPAAGMFDLSPMAALFLLFLLRQLAANALGGY